jgi:hypothetical protein
MNYRFPAAFLFSLTLATACGEDNGGGGGGGGGRGSSLESSKTLDSLSTAERTTLCRWMADKQHEYDADESSCVVLPALRTTSKADCEQERAACLETLQPEEAENHASRLNGCAAPELDEGCTMTVAVVEQCLDDLIESMRSSAKSLSCEGALPKTSTWQRPVSCAAIPSGCFPSG